MRICEFSFFSEFSEPPIFPGRCISDYIRDRVQKHVVVCFGNLRKFANGDLLMYCLSLTILLIMREHNIAV